MRLTAAQATAALNHLGFELTVAALWQWKARGHISRERGYDPDEIAAYLLERATREKQPELTQVS